jgi:hypothetical protein
MNRRESEVVDEMFSKITDIDFPYRVFKDAYDYYLRMNDRWKAQIHMRHWFTRFATRAFGIFVKEYECAPWVYNNAPKFIFTVENLGAARFYHPREDAEEIMHELVCRLDKWLDDKRMFSAYREMDFFHYANSFWRQLCPRTAVFHPKRLNKHYILKHRAFELKRSRFLDEIRWIRIDTNSAEKGHHPNWSIGLRDILTLLDSHKTEVWIHPEFRYEDDMKRIDEVCHLFSLNEYMKHTF